MKGHMANPDGDPIEIRRRIDAVCDDYEAAFRSGTLVYIEVLLQQHSELPRADLLRELIELEVDLRCQTGGTPSRSEYLQRFPDSGEILDSLPPQLFSDAVDVEANSHNSTSWTDSEPAAGDERDQREEAEPALRGPGSRTSVFPQIPGFTILSQIGQGGMGVVYRAFQEDLKRPVAIKTLKLDGRMDRRQILRFQNEAQAAAHLQHTNIVPVYNTGHINGLHYYVMQLIDGRDLADHIQEAREQLNNRRTAASGQTPVMAADTTVITPGRGSARTAGEKAASGSYSWPSSEFLDSLERTRSTATSRRIFENTVRIGIQAAEALHHAHLHGVVHRDIKPSNLMLGEDGRVWVTDFGLAQVQGAAALTMTGEVLGTYRYMSPEQPLANHVLLDQRTDVYSLGVTLYELLTLKKAFDGANSKEILRQVCFEDPVPPRRINPAIPEDLETIVLKCISKRPEERYQTALELAEDLRRFADDEPILARRPRLWQRCRRWSVRHPATAAALAVSFVLLSVSSVIASSVLYRQARNESQLRQQTEVALADAEVGRLNALSLAARDKDPTLATLLAIEAADTKTDDAAASVALIEALRNNHEIRLWNPRGKHVLEVGMALHPNGRRVVTTAAFGYARTGDFPAVESDLETGKFTQNFGTKGVVNSAAWSPDGRFLLTTSISLASTTQELDTAPVEIRLWNAETGRSVLTVTEAGLREVTGAEFSPDSQRLVIPSTTGSLQIFSVQDGTELGPAADAGSPVKSLSFTADGSRLACLLADGRLRVRDFMMQAWTADITVPAHVLTESSGKCVFVNPTTILVSGDGGSRFFSTETRQDITAGNLPFTSFSLSKSGKALVLFRSSNQVVVYDTKSLQPTCRIEPDLLLDFAILSEDGRYVALITNDRTISVYRIPDGRHITTLHIDSLGIQDAAFSGPEELVALTKLGDLSLWSLKSGLERHTITQEFRTHSDLATTWSISNDSAYITFSQDYRLQTDVFDLNGQKVGAAFSGATVSTTPNLQQLAFVNAGKVQLLSEAFGGVLQTLDLPGLEPDEATAIPGSNDVLIMTRRGRSVLWNAAVHSLREVSDPGAIVTDQAVHPVTGTLALAQDNGTLLVRKSDAEPILRLQHSGMVTAITFSNSGRLLATADTNGQLRIWDLQDPKLPRSGTLDASPAKIRDLLFSADEKQLFCRGGTDSLFSIRCWNTETDTLKSTSTPVRASGFALTETPGELLIATYSGLRLWNYETGTESVLSMVPAKKVLSVGKYAFTLEPQNPADQEFSNTMLVRYLLTDPAKPEKQPLHGVGFSLTTDRTNQRVLASTISYHAAAVNLADHQQLTCSVGHSQPILLQKFRGTTRTLVTASPEGTIAIWDLETNNARRLSLSVPAITNADLDRGGLHMAMVHADGSAQILNLESEQLLPLPQEGGTDVESVRISPDGQYLVTVHRDRRSQLWRIAPGQGLSRVSELLKNTDTMCWSADSQQLLVCGSQTENQHRAEILRPATSERLTVEFSGKVSEAQFRSDGRQVLLTEFPGKHRVYDTTTGRLEAEAQLGQKAVWGNLPDQLWLLSEECTVLWDLKESNAIQQIPHRNVPDVIMRSLLDPRKDWQPESPDSQWVFCPGNMLEKWPRDLLEFAKRTVPRKLSDWERRQNQLPPTESRPSISPMLD